MSSSRRPSPSAPPPRRAPPPASVRRTIARDGAPWHGGSVVRVFVAAPGPDGYAPAPLAAALRLAADAAAGPVSLVVTGAGVLRVPPRRIRRDWWARTDKAAVEAEAGALAGQLRDALGPVPYAVAVGIDGFVTFDDWVGDAYPCAVQLMATIEPNAGAIALSWKVLPVGDEWDLLWIDWDTAARRPTPDAVARAATVGTLTGQRVARLVCFDAYAFVRMPNPPNKPGKRSWDFAVRRQLAQALTPRPDLALSLVHLLPRTVDGGLPSRFRQAWANLADGVLPCPPEEDAAFPAGTPVVACAALHPDDPTAFARVAPWCRCDPAGVDVHLELS